MTSKKNEKTEKKNSAKKSFAMIMNGEFLTKDFVLNNLPFIFFIIFLLIISVAKGYYSKKLIAERDQSEKELQQKKAEYVEANARFEEESLRYKLIDKVDTGLVETLNATKVIRVKR